MLPGHIVCYESSFSLVSCQYKPLPSLVTNNDMNSKIISKKLFDRYSKEFVSSDTPSKSIE